MMDEKQIREALKRVIHPKLKKSLVDIGMIRNIMIKDEMVLLTLALKSDRSPLKKRFVDEIEKAVGTVPGVSSVQVETMGFLCW